MTSDAQVCQVAVVGGGPAGLMAAEGLGQAGLSVTCLRSHAHGRPQVPDGRARRPQPHPQRGRGALSRPLRRRRPRLRPLIEAFRPADLRAWCEGLGQETFVGSSGRVFPKTFKASPLLRAWLDRLDALGVRFALRHRWTGWDEAGASPFRESGRCGCRFGRCDDPRARRRELAAAGLRRRLGRDPRHGAACPIAPLRPANMGFTVAWSEVFRSRFEGEPLKRIALTFEGEPYEARPWSRPMGSRAGPSMRSPLRFATLSRRTARRASRRSTPRPDPRRARGAPCGATRQASPLRPSCARPPAWRPSGIGLIARGLSGSLAI